MILEYIVVLGYCPISVIIVVIHLPFILATFSSSYIDNSSTTTNDPFQVKQIYPTKPNGREWFIDMDNPRSDGLFFITLIKTSQNKRIKMLGVSMLQVLE